MCCIKLRVIVTIAKISEIIGRRRHLFMDELNVNFDIVRVSVLLLCNIIN